MPIWEDEEEVIYVYSFLYQLLQKYLFTLNFKKLTHLLFLNNFLSNHSLILGNDNCNVPHIVSIILEVFARTVIDHSSELGQKLISYIKFVNVYIFVRTNYELCFNFFFSLD